MLGEHRGDVGVRSVLVVDVPSFSLKIHNLRFVTDSQRLGLKGHGALLKCNSRST